MRRSIIEVRRICGGRGNSEKRTKLTDIHDHIPRTVWMGRILVIFLLGSDNVPDIFDNLVHSNNVFLSI